MLIGQLILGQKRGTKNPVNVSFYTVRVDEMSVGQIVFDHKACNRQILLNSVVSLKMLLFQFTSGQPFNPRPRHHQPRAFRLRVLVRRMLLRGERMEIVRLCQVRLTQERVKDIYHSYCCVLLSWKLNT